MDKKWKGEHARTSDGLFRRDRVLFAIRSKNQKQRKQTVYARFLYLNVMVTNPALLSYTVPNGHVSLQNTLYYKNSHLQFSIDVYMFDLNNVQK